MDIEQEQIYTVIGPSGGIYEVQTAEEVTYYDEIMRRYLDDNIFKNVSDLQEIERLLLMELLVWRWGNWLSVDRDYTGSVIDPQEIRTGIKGYSVEIRLIKAALGIDKSSRDKDKGSSLAEWIENVGRRAKEFGYHRENQLTKALILFNELSALITLYKNCDEVERREMHCTQNDVFDWIITVCIPEYEELDRYFKEHQQRFWIKDI